MADELRCYLVIDASAPRSAAQWSLLINAVKNKPVAAAIRDAAHANAPCNGVHINRPLSDARYMLGDFEVAREDVDSLLIVLNEQCTLRSIEAVGNVAKFELLLQAELREAATDLGYTPQQAAVLSVQVIGLGTRQAAINDAQLWVDANIADWQ